MPKRSCQPYREMETQFKEQWNTTLKKENLKTKEKKSCGV